MTKLITKIRKWPFSSKPTLRDRFAMAALSEPRDFYDPSRTAAWAYAIADAMLEERKEKNNGR